MKNSALHLSEVYNSLSTSPEGLSFGEVKNRLLQYGKNQLPEKKKSRVKMFFLQFASPLIFILFAAVGISLAIPLFEYGEITKHDLIDPIAILIILLLNALFGFFQELKAENTLLALKNMQPEFATVLRDGQKIQVESEEVVPGDILYLAEGDQIPADARLIEAVELKTIEAALTGESLSIEKDAKWAGEGAVAEQKNMLFSGTQITTGRAVAIIVSTALETELGKIAKLVSEVETPPTPLEKRLSRLGKKIGYVVVGICLVVFGIAFFRGIPLVDAMLTSVALAVGAIPEGLPAVMTISLAIGVKIMAKKNALVRELRSVETLGNVTVIASDKTGTITENKMKVVSVYVDDFFSPFQGELEGVKDKNIPPLIPPEKGEKFEQMLEVAENCNDAELPHLGDPTEIALLQIAEHFTAKKYDRISEIPFTSEKKWMSTTHQREGEEIEFLKGAPEAIAEFCSPDEKKEILEAAKKMAEKGLRTIAAAVKKKGAKQADFLGIFGLQDPPRATVKHSIELAKGAGIRTVMITGDHGITAQAIGQQVGLSGTAILGSEIEKMTDEELQEKVKTHCIFARVSPEHKVRICTALQQNGEVVAMTGDGVNDAPAIRKAEVGISMGKVGTSVAREASDLVLLDDSFSSIVRGIKAGRRVFINIKKSILFLLRTNFSEVFLILIATIMGLSALPLLPIHLLFLNLLTDSFPALALAAEPSEKNSMKEPPRSPKEGFLTGQLGDIFLLGGAAGLLSLFVFLFALPRIEVLQAQTLTLATLVCIELSIIFSIRRNIPLWHEKWEFVVLKNPWVYRSVLLGFTLFFVSLFTPLSEVMRMQAFPFEYWIIPVFGAVILFIFAEWIKVLEQKGIRMSFAFLEKKVEKNL